MDKLTRLCVRQLCSEGSSDRICRRSAHCQQVGTVAVQRSANQRHRICNRPTVAVVPVLVPVLPVLLLLLLLAVDDPVTIPVTPAFNPISHLPAHYAQRRCN
jgi:hypothetical protein